MLMNILLMNEIFCCIPACLLSLPGVARLEILRIEVYAI